MRRPSLRLRYSLRFLLLAMTLVCLAIGWKVHLARQRERAISRFLELGATIDSYEDIGLYPHRKSWLEKCMTLSGDYESPVGCVRLTESAVTDDDLRLFRYLPETNEISLHDTDISDEGLQHLTRLAHLEYLSLDGTRVTDKGMEYIAQIESLGVLRLCDTRVTDAGLAKIQYMPKLFDVDLHGSDVSNDGWDYFELNLPAHKGWYK